MQKSTLSLSNLAWEQHSPLTGIEDLSLTELPNYRYFGNTTYQSNVEEIQYVQNFEGNILS